MKHKIKIGDILVAKDDCKMSGTGESALKVGKKYPIRNVVNNGIYIQSEACPNHFFHFGTLLDHFDLIPVEGKVYDDETVYKETKGKLFYELDWPFITQMAQRMADNKKDGKYELFNWKKQPSQESIEGIKQAMFRHVLKIMEGEYEDDGKEYGHIEALANNAMILNYQLKNLK